MEFQNGKIYTIRSHQTNKYYIGSTNQLTLAQRLGKHRSNYKEYLTNNNNSYISSFEILQHTDHYIELLELYPCNTKAELYRREGELIRQFKSDLVNIVINGRTAAEYRVDNKEQISEREKQYDIDNKERKKQYRLDNKEHIAERQKQYSIVNVEHIMQYHKQHYISNIEQIKEQHKKYYNDNKLIILEQKKQPYICVCGLTVTKHGKAQHMRTTKHINLINQQILLNNELTFYNL